MVLNHRGNETSSQSNIPHTYKLYLYYSIFFTKQTFRQEFQFYLGPQYPGFHHNDPYIGFLIQQFNWYTYTFQRINKSSILHLHIQPSEKSLVQHTENNVTFPIPTHINLSLLYKANLLSRSLHNPGPQYCGAHTSYRYQCACFIISEVLFLNIPISKE